MKFTFVPSLESIALASISTTLWKIWSPRAAVSDELPLLNADRLKAQDQVCKNVQKLILPKRLKEKLTGFAEAVGSEILRWLTFLVEECELAHEIPPTFVWTCYGTVDLQKTANMLVCDDTIHIVDRFRLACIFCLEEQQIMTLYNELGARGVYVMMTMNDFSPFSHAGILITYWVDYIQAKLIGQRVPIYPSEYHKFLIRSPTDGYKKSLVAGHVVAAKFFYLKSPEMQMPLVKRMLTKIYRQFKDQDSMNTKETYYPETLCFLLNTLNEDQQIQVLKSVPHSCLRLFLKWPWLELFIKVYEYIGHQLSVEEFLIILNEIKYEKSLWYLNSDNEQIIAHVWQNARINYREFVHNNHPLIISDLFSCLCEHESWYACNLLLNDATEEQRREMLTSITMCFVFASLIAAREWNSIEDFVTKCHLTNMEIVTFKNALNKRYYGPDGAENLKTFNNLIYALITVNE